jgi:hypothetical protein
MLGTPLEIFTSGRNVFYLLRSIKMVLFPVGKLPKTQHIKYFNYVAVGLLTSEQYDT